MAARSLHPRHQDEIREKIKCSQLINFLTNHALGKIKTDVDPSRVTAALGLLKKRVPDLSATEHSGALSLTQESAVDLLQRGTGGKSAA